MKPIILKEKKINTFLNNFHVKYFVGTLIVTGFFFQQLC